MLDTLSQMNTVLKKLVDLLDEINTTQNDMLLELEGVRDQLTIMNEDKENRWHRKLTKRLKNYS